MIYLDYAANSPVDREVLDLYYESAKQYYANPNTIHKMGIDANKKIEEATLLIADKLKVNKEEIIYTSGASESNNLAIKGIAKRYKSIGKHIIISALEHNSVIASVATLQEEGFEIDVLPIKKNGIVDIDSLNSLIRDDTILVSICAVDSEIGITQPIEEIGKLLNKFPNVHFHCDATHSIGKVNIDYKNVDLITLSPHKFYGLPGIGILVKKSKTELHPIINGGRSTTVYRSGTPDTASIIACSLAIKKAIDNQENNFKVVLDLYNLIIDKFKTYDEVHLNNVDTSIPFTINISIKNVKSIQFVKLLEKYGIIVSIKTSCCPIESPSKLVYNLTKDKSLAVSSVRISLSHLTTYEEVREFLEIFDNCLKEIKNGK